jgi:hypothetical protein
MRPVSRRNLEKAVLKLFHRLGRPVHIGDLKKEFGVRTKASSTKKTSTERDLIARTLLHLFKAGRVCKSERVVRVGSYPVSPYAKIKGKRVVNVRFYAPPEYAGETICFELNGSSYSLRFIDIRGVDSRPRLTKKQMVVEVLRESDSALTSNEILQAINEKYDAYEIKSKKDFYNATSSLMRAVLRKLLREGLRGRKIDGRWIWYYTEEQLERFQRRYVEEDFILRCVRDLVRSERCVPVTRVASMLHATPGEVAYKVRKAGKVLRVKVRITTDKTRTNVYVEVPEYCRDSLVRWLGVVVPCSENGFGYETMLVDLDADWEEALKEEIRKSLSRIHIKTLIGYFYEKLVAKLFNHLCTGKELRRHPVLSRYVIPFVFRSEKVVNVWTTMKGGRRGEFDVLIRGTFRAFDVMAGGKSFLDLVIPIESKYSVVTTEHVTTFDEKIRRVFGESRNVIPIIVGLAWRPDALSLAKRFGFMTLYFSSINNLLRELTATDYDFKDEWKRVERMLNKGELSLLELRRRINNLEIKYLFEELIEARLGKTLDEAEPIPQASSMRIQKGISSPVESSGETSLVPKPMLAHPAGSIGEVLSRHPVLAWEHKIDGIRLLAEKKDGEVRLFSRRGHDRTGMYPRIAVKVSEHFDGKDFILDGELLAIDEAGCPLPPQHLLRKKQACKLRYYVFDVLRLNGSEVVSGQIIDFFNFTLGEHDLTIEAADNLGNNVTETVTFNVIDDVPPVVAIIEPEAGEYSTLEDITVNFTAYDEKSGIASLSATLDGSPVANGQSIDLSILSLGEHVFTVTAIDASDNSASESITFTLVATQVEIRVTPISKNVKEDNNFDFMVHVRSDYSLSSLANATTATFAEGYAVLAVLGGEQLNIKVDVGALESRTYSFTLLAIGDVKVISNTVNVTVFVPSEKGKGKAGNSTVKGKTTSAKGKGKSDEKGKGRGKDKDKDDKGSGSGGWDDDSGGDSGSQGMGNQGQGKDKGKSGDKGNQGKDKDKGKDKGDSGGSSDDSGNQGSSKDKGSKGAGNKGGQGLGNSGGADGNQGQGKAGDNGNPDKGNSGGQGDAGGSSGNADENHGTPGGDENSSADSNTEEGNQGQGNSGSSQGSSNQGNEGDSNSGGQGQGDGGNSGEGNSNAGESGEGSQGNAGGNQGSNSNSGSQGNEGNSGSSVGETSNSGAGGEGGKGSGGSSGSSSESSSSGGESAGSGDSGDAVGSGASDGNTGDSSGESGQGSGNSGNQGGNSDSGGQDNEGNSGSSVGSEGSTGGSESQGGEGNSNSEESSGSSGSGNTGASGEGDSDADSSSGGGQEGSESSGNTGGGNEGHSGNSGSGNNNAGGNGNSNSGGQENTGNSGNNGNSGSSNGKGNK